MHGLEKEIEEWRARMLGGDAMNHDTVRELEAHLRDAMDGYIADGLSPAEALERSIREIGEPEPLNAEFRKIDERGPWARKVLWLLSGFVIVMFALSIVGVACEVAARLVHACAPEVKVHLPFALEIEVRESPISDSPVGRQRIESVALWVIIRALVHFVGLFLACWLGLRWLKHRTPRFDRWLMTSGGVTKGISMLAMIAWLAIIASGMVRPLQYLPGTVLEYPDLSWSVLMALGSLESFARIALFVIMIILAASALSRDRDRANGFGSRGWVFAGYFVIGSGSTVAYTIASVAGVVLYRLFPATGEPSAVLDIWPFHFQGMPWVAGIHAFLELGLLALMFGLVFSGLLLRPGRGASAARYVSRRWRSFLLGWCLWTFGWMTWSAIIIFRYFFDPGFVPFDLGSTGIRPSVLDLSNTLGGLFWTLILGLWILAFVKSRRQPAGASDSPIRA